MQVSEVLTVPLVRTCTCNWPFYSWPGPSKQLQSLSHLSAVLVSYYGLLSFALMSFPGCASSCFLSLDTFIKTLVSFVWSFIPSSSAALILLPCALTSLQGAAWSCRLLGASPWCHAGCRRGRHRDCRTLLVHVRSLC